MNTTRNMSGAKPPVDVKALRGHTPGPFKVKQVFTRWTAKPRYIVLGPNGSTASHPATILSMPYWVGMAFGCVMYAKGAEVI